MKESLALPSPVWAYAAQIDVGNEKKEWAVKNAT